VPAVSLPCRCAYGRSAVADEHGLVPDGWVNPRPRKRYASGEEGGAVFPDCDLCGNTGETTRGRLRAGELAAALSLSGAVMGVATVVCTGVALLGGWGWRPGAAAGAAAVACLLAGAGVRAQLARTATRGGA